MNNLIINRARFKIETPPQMHVSTHVNFRFQKSYSFILDKLKGESKTNFEEWGNINQIEENTKIFFDFGMNDLNDNSLTLDASNYFKPHYIKSTLIRYFEENNFLIEEYPKVYDLCVYQKIGVYNALWSVYRRFDILIKIHFQEIAFNIGSSKTLISNEPYSTEDFRIRGVTSNNKVVRLSNLDSLPIRVIANKKIRDTLFVKNTPKISNYYKETYKLLHEFYNKHIINIDDGNLTFPNIGLVNVSYKDQRKVNLSENKMQFGNSRRDINAITGMRDFGAFEPSKKALENKFIFIYESSEDANKLYQYFKNGLKHFTGLERYVGIPVTSDREKSLKYTNIHTLKEEFNLFLDNKLPGNSYKNYFAIVIGPFDKQEADEEESDLYYYIKERLLNKEVASQFIDFNSIRNNSTFHFYLPNIAIAILAKMGGIPWRLEGKSYKELVVGFNQVKLDNKSYIGSAVFFSNDGRLGSVNTFPQSTSTTAIIEHLRESIKTYIRENDIYPKRLVIHYYKPHSSDEKEKIETLLYKELGLEIPFAIIEVNDSKTQTDICFDAEYDMGMPESGVYVKTDDKEYLLFNNTRYEKKPLRAVTEELPVKVKIHFMSEGEFTHEELIGQVYEFSRLYWKSLKQRSQPVTTVYAKLIAEFASQFGGKLPKNETTDTTPWFI